MLNLIQSIESKAFKSLSQLGLGQILTVDVLIQEGNKKRIQSYTGVLVKQHRAGVKSTITVRKLSKGITVERIFPIHSPDIENIHAKKDL